MIDLAMHMMDIVQNSLRAGAGKIGIGLKENIEERTLTFSVKDDGGGMDKETVMRLADPFFTTRTTRRVGLGIPFLKMTCEQTGGTFKVCSEEGAGSVIEAVYRTDNPDCLPLGDIAGYLVLLLKANPGVRFRFTYRIDESKFVLDTDELKKQKIEWQHPQMMAVVREYVRENLEEMYKIRPSRNFLCP